MYMKHVCAGAHRGQQRKPDPLGLELHADVFPGTHPSSSARAASALNHVSYLSSLLIVFNSVSQCSPDWLSTYNPSVSASWKLESQVCTTMPSFKYRLVSGWEHTEEQSHLLRE